MQTVSLFDIFIYVMQGMCTAIFTFFHCEEIEKILPDILK